MGGYPVAEKPCYSVWREPVAAGGRFRQQRQQQAESAVRPGFLTVRARFQMMDPALQAVQSLLHPLFIRGGMVQGVIHITDCIIQQGEDFRRGQFFPMRAKSGDVAGERVVKA